LIDIVRLLDEYNISRSEVNSSGWVSTTCPHCDDRGKHGGFSTRSEAYNCFRCGTHSSEYTIKLLLGLSNSSLQEVLERFKSRGSRLVSTKRKVTNAITIELPGGKLERIHKKYLIKRGFDPTFLEEKYKLQGTGPVGDWRFRIIIPVIYKGEVVSFQGRTIIDDKIRYKTLQNELSVIPAKNILYNVDNTVGDRAIIVEGPFDVMRLGDGVVGTLGTGISREQLEFIATKYREVVFYFDPEEEAQKRAEKQGNELSALGISVSVFDSEFNHDAGDMTEEEISIVKSELGL